MIVRRDFISGSVALVASLPAFAQSKRPLVVMMSADNCPPCNVWKLNDLPVWKKSRQFEMVDFKLIEGRDIRELRNPATWYLGREYLPIYQAFLDNQPRWTVNDIADVGSVAAAPRWFIVVEGKLVFVAVAWRRVYSKLDDILNLSMF